MRKAWFLPFLLAAALPAAAADMQAPGPAYSIADSAVMTVRSDAGEDYRIFVAWPAEAPPPQGWPVLYLLDGDDQFATAVVTARRLARARARSGIQPGVVVGIDAGPLARRVRDYTPDAGPDPIPAGAPAHGHATGGADAFLNFVATRIQPIVAGRWPIDNRRRTIAGHSFGGLAVLYDLHRFGHFTAYAAISPSLWYGGGNALPAMPPSAGRSFRVMIASGSQEGGPGGGTGEALAERLRGHGIDASFRMLPGQNHGTTMLASTADVVKFAFGEGDGQ